MFKSRFNEMFGYVSNSDWPCVDLASLGNFKNGLNYSLTENGVTLHCLGVGNFKNKLKIDRLSEIPSIALNKLPPEEFLLRDGDIVFVRSNGNKALVGRSLIVYPGQEALTYSGFCIRFRSQSENINEEYLLHVLRDPYIRQRMAGRGANIQNLNQKILSDLPIPVPPLKMQEEFVNWCHVIDKSKFMHTYYSYLYMF